MGKTIVFSWKIDNTKYGYLCGPEEENDDVMICDRILTDSTLKAISNKVSSWTFVKYETNFTKLKMAISNYTGGQTISGTASDYYYENNDKNYIVLTGKDGSNGNPKYSTIGNETFDEIKKYIDSKFISAKTDLKSEMNSFMARTQTKIESVSASLISKVTSVEEEITEQNSVMASQLEAASNSIIAASKIFDLEAANITVEKLNKAIEDSNETKIWKDSAEISINAHEDIVEYCKNKVEYNSVKVGKLGEKIDEYRADVYDKIASVAYEVENISNKVDNMTNNAYYEQEQQQDVIMGNGGEIESYVSKTETIDNGDGTFDIFTTIGDETFNVKVFGYGKKLRANGNEGVNGLLLASNVMKYVDKSGSLISIINGNIKLSNASGSGKIEIKDDGVYINGVKQ